MQHANAFQLSNIKRIEVLKGPQGTLFGRNAVGGAINVLTLDPGKEFALKASATYGRFNLRQGEVYVSVPLSDRIGFNLSGFVSADDGYIADLVRGGMANPTATEAVRGKILIRTGDEGELKLIGFYTHVSDPTAVAVRPLGGNTAARAAVPPVIIVDQPYRSALDFQPIEYYHTEGASIQFRQGLGGVELTALGSFQNTSSLSQTDSDASPRVLAFTVVGVGDKTYTGEVRISSIGNQNFNWIAGGYYFNGEACYCSLISAGAAPTDATQRSKAYALFAEASYRLGESLTLTGGLRYSDEIRNIFTLRGGIFLGQDSKRFTDVSPRASILYALSEKARVYATYSRGFKSGVYNTSSVTLPLVPVDPEYLNAYEIGLKTEPTRQLRFNLSGFYYDYQNLQVSSRNTATNLTVLQNAATAESYGIEAQLDASVSRNFNLSAAIAYTHSRFKAFPSANVTVPRSNLTGNTSAFIDASGNVLPKAPDFTGNIRADYTVPLSSGSLRFATSLYYSSKYFSEVSNRLQTDAFVTVNARISWLSEGEHYQVTGFIENLTNNRHALTISTAANADTIVDSRPRSFGIKVQYKY